MSSLSHSDNTRKLIDIIAASLDIGSEYEDYRLVDDMAIQDTTEDTVNNITAINVSYLR